MLDESPTLDKNSKKLESFEQISMQLAGDGTKSKNRGRGLGGYSQIQIFKAPYPVCEWNATYFAAMNVGFV